MAEPSFERWRQIDLRHRDLIEAGTDLYGPVECETADFWKRRKLFRLSLTAVSRSNGCHEFAVIFRTDRKEPNLDLFVIHTVNGNILLPGRIENDHPFMTRNVKTGRQSRCLDRDRNILTQLLAVDIPGPAADRDRVPGARL